MGLLKTLYFWRKGKYFGTKSESISIKYPMIMIIWSKKAQLGLEESSEVEDFRRGTLKLKLYQLKYSFDI